MMNLHNNDTDLRRLARESRALADILERIACGLAPTQADLACAPILDRWSIVARPAPVLAGLVTGHPLLGNRLIRTSKIYAIGADDLWVRTWSRFYILGRGLADEQTTQ